MLLFLFFIFFCFFALLRNEIFKSFAKALKLVFIQLAQIIKKTIFSSSLLLNDFKVFNERSIRSDFLWRNRTESRKGFKCLNIYKKNFHWICHQKVRYMIKSEYDFFCLFVLCWNQSWCWSIRDVASIFLRKTSEQKKLRNNTDGPRQTTIFAHKI